MANVVALAQPVPTISVIGAESDASVSGSVVLALPVPVLAGGNVTVTALALPVPQLAINGFAGNVTTGYQQSLAVPTPVVSITGLVGASGEVTLALPGLSVEAHDPSRAAMVLLAPTLAVTGRTGVIGAVTMQQPSLQLIASASVQFQATAAMSVLPTMQVQGSTGSIGSMAGTLKAFALAAEGYTGVTGTATMVLPVVSLDVEGYGPSIAQVALQVPMLLLQATGRTGLAAGATGKAVVMHLEGLSLGEYTNYAFNSMVNFNGVYLGASDAGIFALTGATDNGVAIDAVARVGISDFGTAKLKRVERAYVGYRADGDMELRVITDEDTTRRYLLRAIYPPKAGIHGGHVRIGKGVLARYWQFEIANVAGADFEVNCIEVKPTRMGRRVGNDEA